MEFSLRGFMKGEQSLLLAPEERPARVEGTSSGQGMERIQITLERIHDIPRRPAEHDT